MISTEVSLLEVLIMLAGWPITIFLLTMLILVSKFTPAMKYLKAWWSKLPLYRVFYRDTLSELKVGKVIEPGTAELDDGVAFNTEDSQVMDKKSKVPVYHMFAENAFTTSKTYGPIVQELREKGYTISTYKDYQHLVALATDESYRTEQSKSFDTAEEKQTFNNMIQELQELEINIMPYKTYKMHDLASMFPANISPLFVKSKVTNAEIRARKKAMDKETTLKFLLVGAIAFFIIAIAAIMLLKFVKGPSCQCPEVKTVCQVGQTALKNITM